jgi:hypothetical protein
MRGDVRTNVEVEVVCNHVYIHSHRVQVDRTFIIILFHVDGGRVSWIVSLLSFIR